KPAARLIPNRPSPTRRHLEGGGRSNFCPARMRLVAKLLRARSSIRSTRYRRERLQRVSPYFTTIFPEGNAVESSMGCIGTTEAGGTGFTRTAGAAALRAAS